MTDITAYLARRRYPGRGIALGVARDGAYAVAAYFIMGRSVNSRNRVFAHAGDGIRTEAFDPALLSDPSLILYAPIRMLGGRMIVTNGDQTDTVYDALSRGGTFEGALLTRGYEPDAPHFTPRISGLMEVREGAAFYRLSILRKAAQGMDCARDFYSYASPAAGTGHLLHTYLEGGDPLPTFAGGPAEVSFPAGGAEEIAGALWGSLDQENRVSLCVALLPLAGGAPAFALINRHGGRS